MKLDEKNPKLVEIYKGKMTEYFNRAEYIKKQVLIKSEEPVQSNAGGGSNQAAKKK